MVEQRTETLMPVHPARRLLLATLRLPGWRYAVVMACLLGLGYYELRTSIFESYLLSRYAAGASYAIRPGPSPRMAFPNGGPFEEQRGYSQVPESQRRLAAKGYRIVEQARQSPGTVRLVKWGITPPYREPAVAGLVIRDTQGAALYDARAGKRIFQSFEDVPPLIISTLLFIEDRRLANPADRRRNPVTDWNRLAKAGLLYTGSKLGLPVHVEGGSTLATQLDKYRHSPQGRTASPLDKVRQMTGASLKAYRDGPDTRDARREVVVDYLNTVPLSAAPGYGEVNGLGEGLRAWFGLDLEEVARALIPPEASVEKARAFKHVLALLYAVRAPTSHLVGNRPGLERKIGSYARLLKAAGLIDADLLRMVLETPLGFSDSTGPVRSLSVAERKAANAIRQELRHLLGIPGFYELDRLHLEVESTIDAGLQGAARRVFQDLKDREFLQAHGLRDDRMLSRGDPRHVVYSFLLFERTPEGNLLRVHADNLDQPFDMSDGMKLELGSTAKLRTLVHYLELAAELYGEMSGLDEGSLGTRAHLARDPITRWAAETMRQKPGLDLDTFLTHALDRTYPASPHERFFTGGGAHTFKNFDPEDDSRVMSVRQALVHSTNLVFIRLMRDLVRFHEARLPYDAESVLTQPDQAERQRLLGEVADEEARSVLARAYRRYRGLTPQAVVNQLLGERANSARHLAIAFFAWHPGGDAEALHQWLATRRQGISPEEAQRLARAYGDPRLTILDYGYLLGRQPLEVWCAGELLRNPRTSWDDLLAGSSEARRVASSWLVQTRHRTAQDLRLRSRIERDAFARMTPYWRRLGFPFERLVPSYATAIGSSADKPTALAELMGIIVSDGVRWPVRVIRRLRFAPDTPYHTVLAPSPPAGLQVLPAPVARALRAVLVEVVEKGTARRVRGAFVGPPGEPVEVGGKTGSGDNRIMTFGREGRVLSSRAVNRTSVFVFYIGDRYFGVLAASVLGPAAEGYRFTSALPQAVLKLVGPEINERLASPRVPGRGAS